MQAEEPRAVTVLVVADDPNQTRLIALLLDLKHIGCVTARNPQEVAQLLQDHQLEKCERAFIDAELGGHSPLHCDGYRVMEQLRGNCPVRQWVLMTANERGSSRVRDVTARWKDTVVFQKPFMPDDFNALLA